MNNYHKLISLHSGTNPLKKGGGGGGFPKKAFHGGQTFLGKIFMGRLF